MKQKQENLDAINIIKGVAYSQLMLEDLRMGLCQSNSVDFRDIFSLIDSKGNGKVSALDLIKFLGVHRIAASQRECEYVIYRTGSTTQFIEINEFLSYFSNGNPEFISESISRSQYHPNQGDEMIQNIGEIEVSKLLEKEIQLYRTIEKLKEQYIKKYGFSFKNVISQIDQDKKGSIDVEDLIEYLSSIGVQLSVQEFQAIGRRIYSKNQSILTHKQLMRVFSPYEPLNFPTYRKQNNFKKALDYINSEVAKLNINTQPLAWTGQEKPKTQTQTGFNKIIENYRNPGMKTDGMNTKYFYDQNYYNEMKQYQTNFFNPNRDIKRKVQAQTIGPQYHDHFFSDYYLYLEERDRLEHYFNKFGKRYTFDNPIQKTFAGRN